MALTNNVIFTEGEIGNALKSTSSDHVVAAAQNIYDEEFSGGGYQSEINEFLNDKFGDYLPLSGGDITGDLDVTGDISATNVTADTFTGNLSGNASSATNADKLDNHDSSYFATAANLTSANEEIAAIKASYVQSIQITGSDGIAVTPNTSQNGAVSISISGNAVKEQIEALGKVVNLSGVYAAGTDLNTITGKNGDFIIVGQKEYVYWETATTGESNTKWVLLGDTTQLSQDVTNLTTSYNNHKHSVTATGTVESTFAGGDNTTSKTDDLVNVSVISSAGTLPTTANKSVSLSTHKHNVSVIAEGTVASAFAGDDNTTSKTDDLVNVSVISSAGTLPTTANKNVSLSTHKHNVSVTATGTVESAFTGTAASHDHTFTGGNNTTSNNGLTVTYSSGKLSITTGHTHTVTPTGTISSKSITPAGTVTSTFTGTSASGTVGASDANEDVKVVSTVGTLPSYTNIEVPSKNHIHTVTPTGTVTSTFTGTSASGTVGVSDANEDVKVVSTVGALPSYTNIEVPSKDHTHTVTPTGTVTSTFTGTPVDTGTKK